MNLHVWYPHTHTHRYSTYTYTFSNQQTHKDKASLAGTTRHYTVLYSMCYRTSHLEASSSPAPPSIFCSSAFCRRYSLASPPAEPSASDKVRFLNRLLVFVVTFALVLVLIFIVGAGNRAGAGGFTGAGVDNNAASIKSTALQT